MNKKERRKEESHKVGAKKVQDKNKKKKDK